MLLLTSIVTYILDPNNTGSILFDICLFVGTMLIGAIHKPTRRMINGIWRWFDMQRINPKLDMEIRISGEIQPINQSDFVSNMSKCISDISSSTELSKQNETFIFQKQFTSFDSTITVSPGYDSPSNKYDYIYVRIKTDSLTLKKVKEGLNEIQLYLFRDIVGTINQRIRFNVDKNNEDISINLEEVRTLKLPGKLHIESIVADGEGIQVTFSKDNITINGTIEQSTIGIIEEIVRSNLTA
jgi:hypothetical protein